MTDIGKKHKSNVLKRKIIENELLNDSNVLIYSNGDIYINRKKSNKNRNSSNVYLPEYKRCVVCYKGIYFSVPRIIYKKFIDNNISDEIVIKHKDGDYSNNSINNLYSRYRQSFHIGEISEDNVIWIRNYGIYENYVCELSKKFNLSSRQIKKIVLGKVFKECGGIIMTEEEYNKLITIRRSKQRLGRKSLLSDLQKEEIKKLRKNGMKLKEISKIYGIHMSGVCKITKK